MAVLQCLVRRPRAVVGTELLIDEVWRGRPMGDNPVYKCIAQLRKALGDDQQAPLYIETIPKKGYRLIASVHAASPAAATEARLPFDGTLAAMPTGSPARHAVARPSSHAGARSAAYLFALLLVLGGAWWWMGWPGLRQAGIPAEVPGAIAVLPFVDMSADQDQEYFADGMAEELLNELAKVPSLRVIARSSSFALKGQNPDIATVAERLNVSHVLEGSVRKSGDQLRITAQLIDAGNSVHLWSETYDAPLGDVLTLQHEIATKIAAALHPRLEAGTGPVPRKLDATGSSSYEHYLKGRYFLQKFQEEHVRRARDHFQQALDLDPTMALAWAGLADTYKTLDYFAVLTPSEAAQRTRAAAERALELDPGLAEAHTALATVLTDYYYEWGSAEQHFRDAIALKPSYATAHQAYAEFLRDMGRFDEALVMIGKAQHLDPLSPFHLLIEGIILDLGRRPTEAVARYERLLELHPNYRMAHFYLALAYAHQGRYQGTLDKIEVVDPDGRLPDAVGMRAAALAALGRTAEAHEVLAELEQLSDGRYVSPFLAAIVHLNLGDQDRALDLLDQAAEERSWFVRLFAIVPILDPLREHARFQALLERVGLNDV